MTTGGSVCKSSMTALILSVAPNRNGPWMRKMVDVVRDVLVLQDVHAAVFDIFIGDLRNGVVAATRLMKKQAAKDHAGFDGDREVGKNGEARSDEPHTDVSLGELQQLRISRHSPML